MNLFTRLFKNRFLKNKDSSIDSVHATDTNKVVYRFKDASTPPAFHRSYTIAVNPKKIYFTIDCYGEIISTRSFSITQSRYQSFLTDLLNLDIKNQAELKADGCTGGTTSELDIYISNHSEIKGYMYSCGGAQFGTLTGDVVKATKLFKALIPSLKRRIEASKK